MSIQVFRFNFEWITRRCLVPPPAGSNRHPKSSKQVNAAGLHMKSIAVEFVIYRPQPPLSSQFFLLEGPTGASTKLPT